MLARRAAGRRVHCSTARPATAAPRDDATDFAKSGLTVVISLMTCPSRIERANSIVVVRRREWGKSFPLAQPDGPVRSSSFVRIRAAGRLAGTMARMARHR
jgi:hypothetical protein